MYLVTLHHWEQGQRSEVGVLFEGLSQTPSCLLMKCLSSSGMKTQFLSSEEEVLLEPEKLFIGKQNLCCQVRHPLGLEEGNLSAPADQSTEEARKGTDPRPPRHSEPELPAGRSFKNGPSGPAASPCCHCRCRDRARACTATGCCGNCDLFVDVAE